LHRQQQHDSTNKRHHHKTSSAQQENGDIFEKKTRFFFFFFFFFVERARNRKATRKPQEKETHLIRTHSPPFNARPNASMTDIGDNECAQWWARVLAADADTDAAVLWLTGFDARHTPSQSTTVHASRARWCTRSTRSCALRADSSSLRTRHAAAQAKATAPDCFAVDSRAHAGTCSAARGNRDESCRSMCQQRIVIIVVSSTS
jgi:hypothetical protein